MTSGNLLGPPPVTLPVDPTAARLAAGESAGDVVGGRIRLLVGLGGAGGGGAWTGTTWPGTPTCPRRVPPGPGHSAPQRVERGPARSLVTRPEPGFPALVVRGSGQAAACFEEADEVARVRAFLLDADPQIPQDLLPP